MDDYSPIDHLVIAGPNLAELRAWWIQSAGLPPTVGGSHTGRGTRNELVGIDSSTYIELIGPDPDQPEPGVPRSFGIDDLTGRCFSRFALAVDDLERVATTLTDHGFAAGPIVDMERSRPDGVRLTWRLCVPPDEELAGVMPFFIQWGADTPHPATDLPPACSISGLDLSHPDGLAIAHAVEAATGARLDVTVGEASLAATLHVAETDIDLTIRG
ncbi:MAG: VOC family protein [Acidimicrobiales bacterium]